MKLLDVNESLHKPYFQKGHQHFLIYSLDGSITGNKSGFYIPPVIYVGRLEFYVFARKKLYRLHGYINRVEVHTAKTVHFYEIPGLGLKLKLTIVVFQEITSMAFIVEPSKDMYELHIRMGFPFDYVWHENPTKATSTSAKGRTLTVNSLFDKHLRAYVRLKQDFKYANNTIRTKLKRTEVHLVGSSDIAEVSGFLLGKSTGYTTKGTRSKEEKYDRYLCTKSQLACSDKGLENTFLLSKYNIRLLRHYQPGLGEGYFAGIPMFPEFFSRDTFWSVPGIMMSGDFENVKYALNVFARYQSKHNTETAKVGEIPHEIWLSGEADYYSADGTILYIYALYYYYKWSADTDFIRSSFPHVEKAFEWMKRQLKHNRIINRAEGFLKGNTWMDSYNRSDSAVEMQAMLAKACFYVHIFAKILNRHDISADAQNVHENAKSQLNSFWTGSCFADRIKSTGSPDRVFTANQLVAMMFGYASRPRAAKVFEQMEAKGLVSRLGIRSRAKKASGYDAGHYHKGMVWPLASGWGALSALRYGNNELALRLIDTWKEMAQRYVPGLIPETLHGNRFTLKLSGKKFSKEKEHFGSFLQLWSAAIFVQVMVEGVLGIDPLPRKRILRVRPVPLYDGISIRNLRVFDGIVDVVYEKGRTAVTVKSGRMAVKSC